MEEAVKSKVSVCWLRRDLRLEDNTALYHALKGSFPVLVIYIFDRNILDELSEKSDKRVVFIHRQLQKINEELWQKNSTLVTFHTTPNKAFEELLLKYDVQEVFVNHDYEPYAISRDQHIQKIVEEKGGNFYSYKDQVIFEKEEVLKPNGTPYTVYTPYSKKWKEQFFKKSISKFPSEDHLHNLYNLQETTILPLTSIGFSDLEVEFSSPQLDEELLFQYHKNRDLPAVWGTSHLGVHLRFGTVSIREVVSQAFNLNKVFFNELIWREFFMMILYHFPRVEKENFRRKYDRLQWRNNEKEFELWCRGETGYPMVDAGMRQLNKTGWMHNRVRMITAGFLTKHLLVDWRWGEAYFAQKLLDYEKASNNGNWQWAAGTGCDSAPYFRIFNPATQLKKFDPDLKYVKTWIEDFKLEYLPPIVEHSYARNRALETYKKVLNAF